MKKEIKKDWKMIKEERNKNLEANRFRRRKVWDMQRIDFKKKETKSLKWIDLREEKSEENRLKKRKVWSE